MKKNIFSIINLAILVLTISLMSSCVLHVSNREDGEGKQTTKVYNVNKAFTGIDSQTAVEIIYTVSDTISIKAEGTENLIKHLQITVGEDSILHIYMANDDKEHSDAYKKGYNDGWLITPSINNGSCKLYISGPNLNSLNFSSAADFTCEDTITSPSMNIVTKGASQIDIKSIETGDFKNSTKGASDIKIGSIKAQTATIETKGASNQNVSFVNVNKITVTSKGASSSELKCTNCGNATIRLSGAGDVDISGTLHHLDKNVDGMGSINDDDLTIK